MGEKDKGDGKGRSGSLERNRQALKANLQGTGCRKGVGLGADTGITNNPTKNPALLRC